LERSLQVDILKTLIAMLDRKENVDAGVMYRNPVHVYTCSELAVRETEVLFKGHPQLVGLSGDLPGPGTFKTVDEFGVPLLVVRDAQGRCRAFLNICRHRGVRVVSEAQGKSGLFSCPFHRWTYNDQGALITIPNETQFGGIDKSCRGLAAVPMEERHGMLWVHPSPDGTLDLDTLLGGLADELGSWGLGNLVQVGRTRIAKRLNWKLANDTFGETYHFQKLHKDTLAKVVYGDCLHYVVFGRNHRFVFPLRAIDSMKERPEDEWRLTQGADALYYLFPNIQLIVSSGAVNVVHIYPCAGDPSHSISIINHYLTPQAIAAAAEIDGHDEAVSKDTVYDYTEYVDRIPSLARLQEVFSSTVEHEDYAMGESTQRAAESGALDHLLFGRNEPALHHFHRCFREALRMPPLEPLPG